MPSPFEGMAGLLNGIFGDPVTVIPVFGDPARSIRGVFRREPIEVSGEDGFSVLVLSPTLRVPATEVLKRGDIVEPTVAPGSRYMVMNGEPSPSPASDRFVIYELEVAE